MLEIALEEHKARTLCSRCDRKKVMTFCMSWQNSALSLSCSRSFAIIARKFEGIALLLSARGDFVCKVRMYVRAFIGKPHPRQTFYTPILIIRVGFVGICAFVFE